MKINSNKAADLIAGAQLLLDVVEKLRG